MGQDPARPGLGGAKRNRAWPVVRPVRPDHPSSANPAHQSPASHTAQPAIGSCSQSPPKRSIRQTGYRHHKPRSTGDDRRKHAPKALHQHSRSMRASSGESRFTGASNSPAPLLTTARKTASRNHSGSHAKAATGSMAISGTHAGCARGGYHKKGSGGRVGLSKRVTGQHSWPVSVFVRTRAKRKAARRSRAADGRLWGSIRLSDRNGE